jgi:hypothetical protein
LFKLRTEDALSECHSTLRSLADGTMKPPPGGQFTLSVTGLKLAQVSLKQVTDFAAIRDAVEGVRGWYTKSWAQAAERGVHMTMVLILSRKDLDDVLVEARTVPMPAGAFIALSEEVPIELDENYMIVDDRVVSFSERRADGTVGERTVSIVPVEVERMVKRFDQILRYARKAEDILNEANPRISRSNA